MSVYRQQGRELTAEERALDDLQKMRVQLARLRRDLSEQEQDAVDDMRAAMVKLERTLETLKQARAQVRRDAIGAGTTVALAVIVAALHYLGLWP